MPPITDRLRAAYPELQSGRFMVIADFERPEQATMFAVAPRSAADHKPRITTRRARNETGAGSLEMRFDSAVTAVLATDDPAAAWSLPRDWSGYQMLLMSIYSPRAINGLQITVRGTRPSCFFVQARLPLRAGWNVIHIDCGEMAECLDLSDIRQIQWSFSGLDEPVVLNLDDVVLVDNARQVWGSPTGEPGDLYVTHEGRRIHVGAVGRFELVFHRGLITGWYNVADDSTRAVNLVTRDGMGPMPLLLPTDAGPADDAIDCDPIDQWAIFGPTPQTRQVLEEVSALRAVIRAEWSWDAVTEDNAPVRLTWRYAVYPSGRVFVLVDCPTAHAGWQADQLAIAVLCDGGRDFAPAVTSSSGECTYGLLSQRRPHTADLLLVPHHPRGGQIVPVRSASDTRVGMMLRGSPITRPRHRSAHLLVVWPPDLDSELTAESIARDYCEREAPQVDWGRLVLTDAGDLDNDGYNESEGVFVLAPQDNTLRFTCDREARLRFCPTIKLLDTADKDVWIYANGRVVRDVARTAAGDVIARVADTIDEPLLVEVHCRDRKNGRDRPSGKDADATP